MFAKLKLYDCSGTLREGFKYNEIGERFININHIVEVSDSSDGYSAITFHGGNSYVKMSYFVRMKADALVAHLSAR
jgi:hypothetical protein